MSDSSRVRSAAEQIATALTRARTDAGLTQEELALKAGVSRATVARIEAGHHTSTAKLSEIAEALGMSLSLQSSEKFKPHSLDLVNP